MGFLAWLLLQRIEKASLKRAFAALALDSPREAPHNFCAKICLHRSVEKKAHEAEKRFVILGALNGCEKRWQQQIMTFRCYFWAHRDRVSPTNPSFLCLHLQLVNLLGWQARLLFT